MTSRQRKALLTYVSRRIISTGDGTWFVRGRKKKNGKYAESYVVHVADDLLVCNCPGFQRSNTCKHVDAVDKHVKDGPYVEGYATLDETKRATYPQDNVRYRAARKIMLQALPLVIRALARHVFPVTGERSIGRPFTELCDVIYCIALRSIFHKSGAFAQSLVQDAWNKRLLYRRPILDPRPPSEEAITLNMSRSRTYEAMQRLIEESNMPFKGKRDVIALDGSEFLIASRVRAHRKGVEVPAGEDATATDKREEPKDDVHRILAQQSVKLHAAVSTTDKMVVAAHVTWGKSSEVHEAIPLIETAQRVRFVEGVIADKGYPSADLIAWLHRKNIRCAIPPKVNYSAKDLPGDDADDAIMREHVRQWRERGEAERSEYGMRQIVESSFSRIKRLTRADLLSRTFESQRTEVLCHVLVANCAWLITQYVAGAIDIPWLDGHCRKTLDPARLAVSEHPQADKAPRFRDGLDVA